MNNAWHLTPILTGRILLGLLILPAISWAMEPLTFDETLQRALAQQPSVQAYQSAASAAREQAQEAAQLPDPQLKFGVINMPITGSDSLRLNRDDMTMSTIGLMQNMVRPVKRVAASAQLQEQAEVLSANRGLGSNGTANRLSEKFHSAFLSFTARLMVLRLQPTVF